MPVMVSVMSSPGREDITRLTLSRLAAPPSNGWFNAFGYVYGEAPRAGVWNTVEHPSNLGARRNFWKVLEMVPVGWDLVSFEDDILPCKNLVEYVTKWLAGGHHVRSLPLLHLTTFFNGRGFPEGLRHVDVSGFWFSQAMAIPARIVKMLRDHGPDAKPIYKTDGPDIAIGRILKLHDEPYWQHRSLVQHVGARSVFNPSARLEGARAPARDFVGEDFDALTLL